MEGEAEDIANLQAFLKTRRESIAEEKDVHDFGFTKAYISPGALEATMALITEQEVIGPQDTVLDVGCGLGGASISIAKTYGANVLGIDTSANMLAKANDIAGQLKAEIRRKIHFDQQNATTANFDFSSFDVIFSRDTSIRTGEGEANVLTKFYKWLKPNGRIILIDFWKSEVNNDDDDDDKEESPASLILKTGEEHQSMLEKIGFEQIFLRDMTEKCKAVLAEDIKSLLAAYNNAEEKDKRKYSKMIKDWQQTLFLCEYGFQKWGLIMAVKV